MAKKKDKTLYDENGRWVEERGRVKGAVRRSFRLSPQMKEVLQAARVELPPALKKDGTPGKRNQVRYRCAACKELFSQKDVQVDHLKTVVPLCKKEKDMTYDEIVRGVFCDKDNLQVLCSTPMKRNDGKSSCHKKKTDEEKYIRKNMVAAIDAGNFLAEDNDLIIEKLKKRHREELKEKEEKKNGRKRKSKKG